MIIKEICLYNFGSYEELNRIVCQTGDKKKNIVLFGGKNGAGKTTLFTAIQIALYGSRVYGYAANNVFYSRKIEKLINNKAKLTRPSIAYVELNIDISNGLEIDQYKLNRKWILDEVNVLSEEFTVHKNEEPLSKERVNDFEAFIMQIMPPELFNLYFFDGEKIVDFFLAEGSNKRIKKAFMTLCGYDTLEIMQKNFQRVINGSTENNLLKLQYRELEDKISDTAKQCDSLRECQSELKKKCETVEAKVTVLDAEYRKSGGVSEQEWSRKFEQLKEEEYLRDRSKAQLKEIAKDTIPFLILQKQMEEVNGQIEKEAERERAVKFLELLSSEDSRDIFRKFSKRNGLQITKEQEQELIADFSDYYEESCLYDQPILQLSNDEIASFLHVRNRIEKFDVKSVERISKTIKDSLKRSQVLTKEIELCNINAVSDYVEQRSELLKEMDSLKEQQLASEQQLFQLEWEKQSYEAEFKKVEKAYMEELRADSKRDISGSAMVMLFHLQDSLFRYKINKVETSFLQEINRMIRKKPFIDEIVIDSEFNILVYRNVTYSEDELIEIINKSGTKNLESTFGKRAAGILFSYKDKSQSPSLAGAIRGKKEITLPIELDKNSFSSGEKQIFIMAFYRALMKLCRQEIPFVIDTPFARIDAEHRHNIVNYFFKELEGQVFILSTDEEISEDHAAMMKDRLAASYTLVNTDDSKTTIIANTYFGES